jgi:cation diffusion facilitator family transporter
MTNITKTIIKASWISIFGNAFLSVTKISIGLISGSMAVVGDGIDSGIDIVTSVITLFTARIISKPPNLKYAYGYKKADTIASSALAFVIFFAGAQLFLSTFFSIIKAEPMEIPSILAMYITVLSIFGKLLLYSFLFKTGQKTQSSMLIANAKNMKNDVIISLSVLLGLFFTFILNLPVLDIVTALLVSLWIMKSAFQIFMETNIELMDGIDNTEIYNDIFKAIDQVKGVQNPHRARLRKLGNKYIMDIDIEVDGELTVHQSHRIAEEVEGAIKKSIENIYDVIIHIEPVGNIEKDEKFGITKAHIN